MRMEDVFTGVLSAGIELPILQSEQITSKDVALGGAVAVADFLGLMASKLRFADGACPARHR